MRIQFNKDADQYELFRATASKDKAVAAEAKLALAGFIAGIVDEVVRQAATTSLIYVDQQYNEDDQPSIPLDLFYDQGVDTVQVWSQSVAGGLPTTQVEGVGEMKVSTMRLDSAISWPNKWARRGRLDNIAKSLERMAQEVLVRKERNGWAVLLKALGEATTNGLRHTTTTATAGTFGVTDLTTLQIRQRRLAASFANGTPDPNSAFGLTNLFVSPEIKGQIRNWAVNPQNSNGSQSTGPIGLPESVREQIFKSAGATELFDIMITDLIELGGTQKYNVLFGEFAAAGIAHSAGNFNTTNNTLLVGVDLGRGTLISPIQTYNDAPGTFQVFEDDQFLAREDKTGYYGCEERGFVCADARALCGIIV